MKRYYAERSPLSNSQNTASMSTLHDISDPVRKGSSDAVSASVVHLQHMLDEKIQKHVADLKREIASQF